MPYKTAAKPQKIINACINVMFGKSLKYSGHMTERFKEIKKLEKMLK